MCFYSSILFYFLILLSLKKHYISNMLSFCILPLCLMLSYDMIKVILVSFGLFGLSFVYLLDILICIIRLFFLEKSPCICKVKRFIFIINYYLSGNIMWPVYLSQMWISRHTFFCISCSCSYKHLKRLQLHTGECLYYQVSDHFEKQMDGMHWSKCIGFEICICF